MHKYLVRLAILTSVILASGCATSISGATHEALEQPVANLSASDLLRITVISSVDVNIRLLAEYATTSRDCEVQKWPGNPKIGHVKSEVFDVPTSKTGATVDILVDKFEPGRCQWKFGGMSVGAVVSDAGSQAWSGLLALNSQAPVPVKPLRITCGKLYPTMPMSCTSSINYVRSDVRAVTFETLPSQPRTK